MRFLVLTDLHQKRSCLGWINRVIREEAPDFTLFLGDITDIGTTDDAIEILESIDSEIYAIPGNCDPLDMPAGIAAVAHDMHGRRVSLGAYELVGLGGSNITIFGTPFELEEEEIYSLLEPVSSEGMILMTHTPSYGILDNIPGGISVGSHSVRRIVDEFRPILALSGHIHEDRGVVEKGGTVFCNPGPAKDGYCAMVTISDRVPTIEMMGPLR